MHHSTDRITHTTAFVTPVVEHWLEREIALSASFAKNKRRKRDIYHFYVCVCVCVCVCVRARVCVILIRMFVTKVYMAFDQCDRLRFLHLSTRCMGSIHSANNVCSLTC